MLRLILCIVIFLNLLSCIKKNEVVYEPQEKINAYLAKILIEYGRPMPIRLANCLQGDTIEQILNETKKKSRI